MSMPELPDKVSITREDAVNLVLSSIAMEELGISHVINAEGEKLQYALGTLDGATPPAEPVKVAELLEINKSVRDTLNATMQNQFFLNAKMGTVLSAPTMQGPTGPAGPAGPTGPMGPQGPIGNQGIQGPEGKEGPPGKEGPQGQEGKEGPAGSQGIQGVAGTVGTIKASYETLDQLKEAHPTGEPGDFYYINPDLYVWDADNHVWFNAGKIAGPQGLPGAQGERGAQGPQGLVGPEGPRGLQGSQGPQGERGPQGLQGEKGPKGDQGAIGTPGKDGNAATIAPGKVTMLPYDKPPTVENAGTPTNAIFNFGIPEAPPRVRVYRANLSTSASLPLQIPLGNAMYYQLQYLNASELRLFFRPLTGLTQARCDYRIVSQYDVAFTPFDIYQGENAVFTQASLAVDSIIYNSTRETHRTWIRVQNPNNPALWSAYEVNLFSSQAGARVLVWVNVIDEDGAY